MLVSIHTLFCFVSIVALILINPFFSAAAPVMGGALGNPLMLTAGPTGGMYPQQSPMMTGASAPYGMGGSPSGMYGGGL
jgi:hypothetical protein